MTNQIAQLTRQRKDEMEVLRRQKARETTINPLALACALALGAMTISAAVVADLLVAARCAAINVRSQCSGAALTDRAHHAVLLQR